MAAETARAVGCELEEVIVMSTGVIGVQLSLDAGDAPGSSQALATPCRWTAHRSGAGHHDDRPVARRNVRCEVTTPRGTFRIGGICKGAGMIEPRMATMLGVLTCDAAVSPALLHRVLAR